MMHCVLLNADYSFLNMVHWKRAMGLVSKGKVQVLSYSDRIVRGAEGMLYKMPAVMRLIKLIRTIYRNRVPFSKRNIFTRDGYRCGYCGSAGVALTIDHIIPKSRGGLSTFENCITSCTCCNARKGCRTPREAGMALTHRPYQPTISEFLRMKLRNSGVEQLLREIGF
ncbi:MAG: HNH endonuclease [Desulfobacteraceae bacterium]|jgi:5-methylcytosine-specific restriction endonuclease McrA|nr:HNH endonuclease [Desulfobacteraceae bacterium]